jgi:hypothetical protein
MVWFCLCAWLALSIATSHKDVLYFSVNEEYSSETWVLYLRGFLLWTLAACYSPLIFKLAHRFPVDEKKHRQRNLFLHLIFSICFLFVMAFTFAPIFWLVLRPDDPFTSHLMWTMYWYNLAMPVAYWFIIGGLLLKKNLQLYNERHQRAVALKSELKKIQLNVLQVQLRPHFLFNVLNTVSSLIYEDDKAAVQILKKIRRYLELSMKSNDKPEITLRKELDFTNLYLDIEKERYSDRLQVVQKIDPETTPALVPNMILQPLVENAIRHGISKKSGPGKLILRAVRNNDHLLLEVEDSGAGFDNIDTVKKEGLGIKNTIERLEKLYHEDYIFDIDSSALGGAKVSVQIPYTN